MLAILALAACQSAPREAAWNELFDGRSLGGFVATEFGGEGTVEVRDGCIQIDMGSPLSGITWTGAPPTGHYELEVIAARRLGTDFFCGLTFPVGDNHLTLVLGGWGGTVCGLSSLDGLDAAHNATRTLRRFERGRDYTVRVRVDATAVTATLDGEPLCRTELAGHTLSLRPEVLLSRPLGLSNFATATSIRAIRWRPVPSGA
ncbi:MAG: DUF1080 domain-containing protein [Planctomycetes bacterium]|jgi:hypothetical protein|nr:DUF1080 domain-containing protein [Planctomycetota bacterium]